jgi:hypothetical protein
MLSNQFTLRFWTKPEGGCLISSNAANAAGVRDEDIFLLEVHKNRLGTMFSKGKERFADGLSTTYSLLDDSWTFISVALQWTRKRAPCCGISLTVL